MRPIAMTAILAQMLAPMLVTAATPAAAASIDTLASGTSDNGSIQTLTCDACPPLVERKKKQTYQVPDLAPGTETVEIRDINGEKKLVRTESWLGGSPVVFIVKASPEAILAAEADAAMDTAETSGKGISGATASAAVDSAATTAAVASIAVDKPVIAAANTAESQEVDRASFELRLK